MKKRGVLRTGCSGKGGIFQNGPFWKMGVSRTAHSGKEPLRQSSRISRTARSGKGDFPERAVLEKGDFPERPVLEKGIFQNGPFWKRVFSRTARSGKEPPRQSSRISRKSSRISRTARFGKGDFLERPVLENPLFQNGPFWKRTSPSEQQNFQNGPFWKKGFYRTARSGKDLPHQRSRISRTARSGKDDFIERAVLENLIL